MQNLWEQLQEKPQGKIKVHCEKYLNLSFIVGNFTSDDPDLNYIYQRWKYANPGVIISVEPTAYTNATILEYDKEEDKLFCSHYEIYLNGFLPDGYFWVHNGCEMKTS